MANTPRLFIGSSSEALEIAEYLQVVTHDFCESTIWNQGVFGLSQSVMQSLTDALACHDYAAIVVSSDDIVIMRGASSPAPRDNIVFELGLFIGSLGPERTFIVYAADDRPHLPTDLGGVTYAPYRNRKDNNWRAALNPVAVSIREAINRPTMKNLTKRQNSNQLNREEDIQTHEVDAAISRSIPYASDLADTLARGVAGIAHSQDDRQATERWIGNALGMLQNSYATRQSDVYAVWLQPTENTPKKLQAAIHRNLDEEHRHYFFSWNEGLAGKAWATGTPSLHTMHKPHPWWVFREGCENATYLCAPVGPPEGMGGMLAVGSNHGFDANTDDLSIVSLFASLLSMTL